MERRRRRRRRRHRSGSSPLPPPPLNRHLSSTPTTVPIPPRRRRSRSPRPCFRRRTPAVTARSARLRVSVSDLDFGRLDFESNENEKTEIRRRGSAAGCRARGHVAKPNGEEGRGPTRPRRDGNGDRGRRRTRGSNSTTQRHVGQSFASNGEWRLPSADRRPTGHRYGPFQGYDYYESNVNYC
ncbi:hypothetical protein V9T40_004759 [Parthenolecanium corni]|uniref:Uncharacterized protein n=1 Tax=Parthenolecanium corni TaxID=536013 RepID=A0AAN9TEF9_9HEMI